MAVRAMKAGAVDFLTKPFQSEDLLDAVFAALQRDRLRRAMQQLRSTLREHYESLSAREREVIKSVAAGKLNKQIAADLGLSEVTVKVHRARCYAKNARNDVARPDKNARYRHSSGSSNSMTGRAPTWRESESPGRGLSDVPNQSKRMQLDRCPHPRCRLEIDGGQASPRAHAALQRGLLRCATRSEQAPRLSLHRLLGLRPFERGEPLPKQSDDLIVHVFQRVLRKRGLSICRTFVFTGHGR